MGYRNATTTFYNLPVTSKPRNKFKFPVHKKHLTCQHGRITPFFTQIVYPGDSFNVNSNIFVRADISEKVPLDDVIVDFYYFYVPFRIIDPDFYKAAGGTDEAYDTNTYSFPQTLLEFTSFVGEITDKYTSYADNLPFYLDYSQATNLGNILFNQLADDTVCSYPLAAYWKIYNEYFRDETLDPSVPYQNLYGGTIDFDLTQAQTNLNMGFTARANRIRDYFSTAMLNPQKGPSVSIPMNIGQAPVVADTVTHFMNNNVLLGGVSFPSSNDTYSLSVNGNAYSGATLNGSSDTVSGTTYGISKSNLVADLTGLGATINQFRISLSLQAWYEARSMFGTRPTEQLLQWGIEAPDGLLQRPEYLGGCSATLNQLPVLNTANSITSMSGQGASIFNDGGFRKSFIEAGVIIGLLVTRVKHEYSQGINPTLWKLKTDMDMYHPLFANIGYMSIKRNEIYNNPALSDNETAIWGYTEAWNTLRCYPNRTAGLFNPTLGIAARTVNILTDLHNKWCYQDMYQTRPNLSIGWLKEEPTEVMRTMTGKLIPNSTGSTVQDSSSNYGTCPIHQYMFGIYSHIEKTAILPAHSIPTTFGLGRI